MKPPTPLRRGPWIAIVLLFAAVRLDAVPVAFDVPAQNAAAAVLAFAKQAGVEVLFSHRDLQELRSTAVLGRHEPEAALALLLRGTGFTYTRSTAGKYVIVRESRQASTVRGVVLAESTGRPPATPAFVALAGSTGASRARRDGTFLLRDVPAGTHDVLVRADGFRPLRIARCTITGGSGVDLGEIRLTETTDHPELLAEFVVDATELRDAGVPTTLQAVIVTPSRFRLTEIPGVLPAMLTHSDLLALPQLGEDLYRAISHLPGLVADDLTARFWVRGAPNDRVLARLDGVELIEPFHLKDVDATLSIIDLETIARMDLYTGGFTAEFGNRTAGVITMETDRPARAENRTTLGISLTGVRAAGRGRTRAGKGRWLVSGRSGFPQLALELTNGKDQIEPSYHDLYAKAEYDPTPGHTVSVHALHAGDRMKMHEEGGPTLNSRYGSDYVWTRWQGRWHDTLRAETVLFATELNWKRRAAGQIGGLYDVHVHDDRRLRRIGLRHETIADWQDRLLARAGFEVTRGSADYAYHGGREVPVIRSGLLAREAIRRDSVLAPSGTAAGAFATLRVRLGTAAAVEPGVRYDANDHAGDHSVSPRLNAVCTSGRTTWRAAWGVYAQGHGLHDLAVADGESAFSRAERATHAVFGVERQLATGLRLRVEAYERTTRRPRPHWESLIDSLAVVREWEYDRVRLDPVRQRARGLEVIAEHRGPRLAWSASYALARWQETLPDGTVLPLARDQRHTVHLGGTYTPNERWQFSVVWQYHTGWPVTARTFSLVTLRDGSAAVVGDYGPYYATRLPAYHRLDLRIQRHLALRRGTLRLYADVFNAYNRRNSAGYRYTVGFQNGRLEVQRQRDDNLFPLLPSVGAVWEF